MVSPKLIGGYMARIEHVNLSVKDINASVEFIQAAFPDWKVRGQGTNSWYGRRRWLHIGDDDYYITLNDGAKGENRNLKGHAPGLAHIGFVVDNLDGVIQRLNSIGADVDIYGENHPFRKTVYFNDPAGFQFEFMEYLSEQKNEKNRYESTGTTSVDEEYLSITKSI